MTIKLENCPVCQNRGMIKQAIFPAPKLLVSTTVQIPSPSYSIKEVYCNCIYGQKRQEFDLKSASPDWINPLLNLSDEQILQLLEEDYKNKKAISEEFE